ncbi:DUF4192 domain-containing protein [Pseudarthrobacter sp. NPDC092424]|uniref:DUF4192 domain-containing protein n=1 Tax=Pseudarthrobacter sp. NPDC092424 TaxID=3364415 RepID=UPI003811399C
MTKPQHLKVRGPEDILGFIPHSLGYWPASSLVAMTMQGRSLGATLRVDLPGPDVLADPTGFAGSVCSYLRADRDATGTLLAVFTPRSRNSAPCGYDGLLALLRDVLGDAGMPVLEAWYVGETFWRDALCQDLSCCPLPGHPVQQIKDSTLNAEMVYLGSSIGVPPGELPGTALQVPAEYREEVLQAEAAWSADLEPRRESRAQFRAVLRTWLEVLARPAGPPLRQVPQRDAFLRATLLVPAWRDAVLVMAAAGTEAAEAGAERFGLFSRGQDADAVGPGAGADALDDWPAAGSETPGYGEVLLGIEPAVPHWGRMEALDAVLEQLAAFGGPAAAASLTGRGWIAWCRGRGSYAAAYFKQSLEIAPGYRLAGLLLEMAGRGTLCGWAGRREAAWRRFGPDAA